MINNFEQIAGLLNFESDDDFYFIEILKRKKDNNEMTKSEKMIDVYEINSIAELENHKPFIIDKCKSNNARAYIHLNKRSRKKIALEMLRELASRVADNNYKVNNLYHSTMGKYHSDKQKTWIIDLDGEQVNLKDAILDEIREFLKQVHKTEFVTVAFNVIPTRNGIHLIVQPFNPNILKQKFKDVVIFKDAPTLLFFEETPLVKKTLFIENNFGNITL